MGPAVGACVMPRRTARRSDRCRAGATAADSRPNGSQATRQACSSLQPLPGLLWTVQQGTVSHYLLLISIEEPYEDNGFTEGIFTEKDLMTNLL